MPSLTPGQTMSLGRPERLLISLRGPGAAECEVVADPPGCEVRRASAGKFVVEAQRDTTTALHLASHVGRIDAAVIVEFRAVGAGVPNDQVMLQELHVVGQRQVPLMECTIATTGEASIRSLVGARRSEPSGTAAEWVATASRKRTVAILLDGSASRAHMDKLGTTQAIVGAVRGCLADVLGVGAALEFVFGSAAQGSDWLTPAGRSGSADLYASGVQVPWAALLERGIDFAVVISDNPHVAQLSPVKPAVAFALLVPQGGTRTQAKDIDEARRFCLELGGDLLVLSSDSTDVERAVSSWLTQRLRTFIETEEGVPT